MEANNKTYGFTIAVKELKETVPNIFRYASAYKRVNNITNTGLWDMFLEPKPEKPADELPKDDPKYKKPLPEDILRTEPGAGTIPDVDPESMEGETYNMCHFWSNFEIARLDWFRSKEYEDFFQTMDRSGGFWMERVRCSLLYPDFYMSLTSYSGVMHPSTRSQQVSSFLPRRSTTSAISATATQQSLIAQQTQRLASSPAHLTLRRQQQMRRKESRKMHTGKSGMSPRKTVLAADADVILKCQRSSSKRAAAFPTGST
jgi:hypothetical protein